MLTHRGFEQLSPHVLPNAATVWVSVLDSWFKARQKPVFRKKENVKYFQQIRFLKNVLYIHDYEVASSCPIYKFSHLIHSWPFVRPHREELNLDHCGFFC